MSTLSPWACPTCRAERSTPFCPECGERPLKPHDLTLRGLAEMVFRTLSRIDDRLIRSVRLLATRPGRLTRAFLDGRRKPYIGPIALFLVANVLFFAVQSMTQMKIFSTSLEVHLNGMFWGDFARLLVEHRLEATERSLASYAPVFDQAIAANAKSMIGLMVPLLAGSTPLLFPKTYPFGVHAAFSLHYHAFLLLLICLPLVAVALGAFFGGAPMLSPALDDAVSVALLVAVAGYFYAAIGEVFGARGAWRVLKTLALVVVAAGSFLAYRFVLLPITLYTT